MKNIKFSVEFNPETEEVTVYTENKTKVYNRIITYGDIGTACKDFAIELDKE